MMLDQARVIAFSATVDGARAAEFYAGTLGLPLVEDTPFALVFDCRGTMLRVQKVPALTPASHTVLGWGVDDVDGEVAALARRGVRFERYPGMEQDDAGIWTSPAGARIAWFRDPDGNTLSLTQFPRDGQRLR